MNIKPKTCGACTYCYYELYDRGVCSEKLDGNLLSRLREEFESDDLDSLYITALMCSIVSRARVDMDMCPERNACPCLEKFESWEKLEADAGKTVCAYFGREDNRTCLSCDHSAGHCPTDQALDIVRRAKKLAGVDE